MEKITGFIVNHLNLEPGVHASRKDAVGPETVTAFDLRMAVPSEEPVMNAAEIHTFECLGTTFLRSHANFDACVLYFGPTGRRTGFYLLLRGDYEPVDILSLLREFFRFATDSTGEVPGTAARDCGSYLDMNLPMVKWEIRRYPERALSVPRLSQLHYSG